MNSKNDNLRTVRLDFHHPTLEAVRQGMRYLALTLTPTLTLKLTLTLTFTLTLTLTLTLTEGIVNHEAFITQLSEQSAKEYGNAEC